MKSGITDRAQNAQTGQTALQTHQKQYLDSIKVHRVGTFTTGIAFIISGIILCLSLFFPHMQIVGFYKYAPLFVALLGIEILVSTKIYAKQAWKYDVTGILLCMAVVFAAFIFTGVYISATYYNF